MVNHRARLLLLLILCSANMASVQQPPVNSPLLDHLVGKWVLRGTIAGKETTHDVTAEWVLDHHYVMIHEISRRRAQRRTPIPGHNLHRLDANRRRIRLRLARCVRWLELSFDWRRQSAGK